MKLLVLCLLTTLASSFANAKTIEVKMLNNGKDGIMTFEPGFVKASVGDTIKFNPVDAAHNSQSVVVPTGAKPWTGKADQHFSVNLTKEGVYIFKCDPHSTMGMVGVVQVGKPTNLAAAKTEADNLSATFVMNQTRLKGYLDQV